MYATIILPLDGSPFAELAIPTAVDIARRSNADLVLVRVHEPYMYENTEYLVTTDQSRRDAEDYLAAASERIEEQFGLAAERSLLEGPIASALCAFADEVESPLIVISTHGRTGFSRFWLGSIADAITRHASSPVLMLRHGKHDASTDVSPHLFKRILVPLDGSDVAEVALPYATSLATVYGARLTLLRVVSPAVVPAPLYAVPYVVPPERFEDTESFRMDAATNYLESIVARVRLDDKNMLIRTDVRMAESPAPAILEAVGSHDADTVVMATHGRGVSRLVMASVADKVVRGGPEAVLVVRPVDHE